MYRISLKKRSLGAAFFPKFQISVFYLLRSQAINKEQLMKKKTKFSYLELQFVTKIVAKVEFLFHSGKRYPFPQISVGTI